MTLLAQSLSERGHTVAQIVFPVADPATPPNPRLVLVYRSARGRNRAGRLLEAVSVWRALREADGFRVVIVRTAAPVVGLAAIFCLVHRRRFVFSAANDSDFTLGDALGPGWHRPVALQDRRSSRGLDCRAIGTTGGLGAPDISSAAVVDPHPELCRVRRN